MLAFDERSEFNKEIEIALLCVEVLGGGGTEEFEAMHAITSAQLVYLRFMSGEERFHVEIVPCAD